MQVNINDLNFQKEVLESDIPVLVDFWARWCKPCLMVAPLLEEIAREYEGKLKVCKLNVDESPNKASEYGIMSIPALVIFKDAKPLGQIIGAVSKKEIEKLIKRYI